MGGGAGVWEELGTVGFTSGVGATLMTGAEEEVGGEEVGEEEVEVVEEEEVEVVEEEEEEEEEGRGLQRLAIARRGVEEVFEGGGEERRRARARRWWMLRAACGEESAETIANNEKMQRMAEKECITGPLTEKKKRKLDRVIYKKNKQLI